MSIVFRRKHLYRQPNVLNIASTQLFSLLEVIFFSCFRSFSVLAKTGSLFFFEFRKKEDGGVMYFV